MVSTEISRLKLQLQTSLSERGVFEMKISQLTDDVKRAEVQRDEVIVVHCQICNNCLRIIFLAENKCQSAFLVQ